jgi:hypothetical protein
MLVITQNVFEFNELSENSKKIALQKYHDRMQDIFDMNFYIFDDCYLFEPKHDELINLFGNEYGELKNPIIGNNRKNITYNDYYGLTLQINKAIEINNDKLFLLWLEIPLSMHDKVFYTFLSNRNGNTKIEFVENDTNYEFTNDELNILHNAENIFNYHVCNIAKNIKENIEYHFSDENIIEEINNNEVYFFENGKIYK